MSWLCVTEALPADSERGRGVDDRGGGSDGMTGGAGGVWGVDRARGSDAAEAANVPRSTWKYILKVPTRNVTSDSSVLFWRL